MITCGLVFVVALGTIPIVWWVWGLVRQWNRRRVARKKFWDSQGW